MAQSRCSPTRGQVRLGFISAVSATLIPWCVSHFYQNPDNQGITFTIDEKPTRRIAADLTHHALDIGFGTRFDDSSFEFCPVVPEELVAVVPAGHPLAQQEQVTLEQLSRRDRREPVLPRGCGEDGPFRIYSSDWYWAQTSSTKSQNRWTAGRTLRSLGRNI